jgi:hypothetical protein
MSLRPETNDKYVGIEIECISIFEQYEIERILQRHNLLDNVDIGEDGSIDAEGIETVCEACGGSGHTDEEWSDEYGTYYDECRECDGSGKTYRDSFGYEFRVLAKQKDLKIILSKLQIALKEMRATVNDSCGLHVHIDMRNRRFTDSVTKLLNMQGMMLRSVPKNRRRNTYCEPVTRDLTQDLANIPKYHVIHTENCMKEYTTVEVRVHEGTVDCSAIYKWVKFLISTVDGNFASKKVRTLTTLPVRIQKYLKERIASHA